MTDIAAICAFFDRFTPPRLAEDWDNVGLLVGDRSRAVSKMMTCLTVTPASAAEAIESGAELIVAHHPLPFRALKRLTTDSVPGRLLLDLIAGGVAVYSPHTAFDSASAGINQRLAEGMQLAKIRPLIEFEGDPDRLGSGRYGNLAKTLTLADCVGRLKAFLGIDGLHVVGRDEATISRVAVACGSAGQFLADARRAGCELLITGETNFHTCLEAEATGVSLLLPGHFASERFAVEHLAHALATEFPAVQVWPSGRECDPLRWS